MEEDFFFCVGPPLVENQPNEDPLVDPEIPSDEEVSAALALIETFPIAMKQPTEPMQNDDLTCSTAQLEAMERLTGVSDVFGQGSPVAQWLLMRPELTDSGGANVQLDDASIRRAFICRKTFWSQLNAIEHGQKDGSRPALDGRGETLLCMPNQHLDSHRSVVGTMYHSSEEFASSSRPPSFSYFALHLPTATSYFITKLVGGRIALDRSMCRTGRPAFFESIVLESDGKISSSLFAEPPCQYCFVANVRETKRNKMALYPGCTCAPGMKARLHGHTKSGPTFDWESLVRVYPKSCDYSIGVFSSGTKLSGLSRPWMMASKRVEIVSKYDHPVAIQMRLSMVQFLVASIPKLLALQGYSAGAVEQNSSTSDVIASTESPSTDRWASSPLPQAPSPASNSPPRLEKKRDREKNHEGRRACNLCDATFAQTGNLTRHIRRMHTPRGSISKVDGTIREFAFACQYCQASFDSISNLSRHSRIAHERSCHE